MDIDKLIKEIKNIDLNEDTIKIFEELNSIQIEEWEIQDKIVNSQEFLNRQYII